MAKRNSNKIFLCWYGHTNFKIKPVEVCAMSKTDARRIYAEVMDYAFSNINAEFICEL